MRLLVLGGTGEAMALARALAGREDLEVITSLAGRAPITGLPPGTVRIGGFGGAPGLAQYLREAGIALVIDATHPYAARISRNAAEAATALGLPLLRLERPPWAARPGDEWIEVDSPALAAMVARDFQRVFLTVGASDLAAFAGLPETCFLVRMIALPETPLPLASHEIILARGPFAEVDELSLLRSHAIEAVVSKNSGGAATYGKIAAARTLGLPVIMVTRPVPTATQRRVPTVATVEDAVRWVGGMRAALSGR
ncbi:MAG: cobalt-precorrin-6A reductase [Rhodospirillaceae bacterium]|nr:cobalt-precorrin-6A reductase [Rhodospirillaceae bacterium]